MVPVHWLERLRVYLAPFRRSGGVEIWDDSKIDPGSDWHSEITAAIDRAAAAILLVGPGFLASDFINDDELPGILGRFRKQGLAVYPLVVAYCGYRRSSLGRFQAFNDPESPLEALAWHEQNKLLNDLSLAVDERVRQSPSPGPAAAERENAAEVLIAMQRQLTLTRNAFIAQCQRRDALVERITARLSIQDELEYEKFFFRYFGQMNAEEKFEFRQIRALTEGPLYNGNVAVFDLLSKHPALLDRFPDLAELRQHLVFWINKYDRVFSRTPEMCVLYTGVEDAVPFPQDLDSKLRQWIESNVQLRQRK
jgi:hypothetical protein